MSTLLLGQGSCARIGGTAGNYHASGTGRDLYLTRGGCAPSNPKAPNLCRPAPTLYRTDRAVQKDAVVSGFLPTGSGRDLFCCRPSTVPSHYLESEMANRDAKEVCFMQMPVVRAAQSKGRSGSRKAREALMVRERKRERKTTGRLSTPLGISQERYRDIKKGASYSRRSKPLALQWRHPDYRMGRSCLLAPL